MTFAQSFEAGLFRCELVGPTASGLRWKVQNTSTTFIHFTYGSIDEVKKTCAMQTAAWERKASLKGKIGSAWRSSYPKKS